MFESLERLPDDPILGLSAACREDPNPLKVDLTVGIYQDATGLTPVFEAVKKAQDVAENYEIFGGLNVIPTGVTVQESPKVTPPQEILLALAVYRKRCT